ncbi:VOC family protein [Paenibacillus xylanivorans]|uniref:VOC domain-containing protein n=1 Tax=Paenibacillus xylanivorans TaxID=1705561 RepID=A0A0M9BQ24_9BACL|nr:VOC family protein [Paenibacillus xylanivorans]KOY16778.1 hypothetical protein AMS66_07805 [Paenibacillus xylanivorans]
MSKGRILGIAYNIIPVSDLEKASEWYVRHFGFNIRNKRTDNLGLFKDNRPILVLVKSASESRAVFEVNGKKRWVTTFYTDDIISLHTYLVQEDVRVGELFDEGQYGKFFTLEDLDGNLFDVWENHDCELNF